MELLDTLYQHTQQNLGYDLAYDLLKIILGFIFARIIYDKWLMKFRWGGRKIIILREGKELASRELSPAVAKRIYSDDTEFSIHIKGVVSPFAWLNKDVSSDEAKECGLVTRTDESITIDLDKNEKKEGDDKECDSEEILKKLDVLEASIKELITEKQTTGTTESSLDK